MNKIFNKLKEFRKWYFRDKTYTIFEAFLFVFFGETLVLGDSLYAGLALVVILVSMAYNTYLEKKEVSENNKENNDA